MLLSSWTSLSSSSRELCRSSFCGKVHLSRSCCELRFSISCCACRTSSRGAVHLSSTSRESCGPHFSSSCSVCRTGSKGECICPAPAPAVYAASAPVWKYISPAPAMSHASPAPTGQAEPAPAPALVQYASSVQHAAPVQSGMRRRFSMEHQSSMEELTRIVTAFTTSCSNRRLAVHLRVHRQEHGGGTSSLRPRRHLMRVLLRSECTRSGGPAGSRQWKRHRTGSRCCLRVLVKVPARLRPR